MQENKKAWRKVKSMERFMNAFRGLRVFVAATRHLSAHITLAIIAIIFGFCFGISDFEWIAVTFAIGLVFITEVFNTAIEIDINLTSPEFHPYARDTKDVAAGAVLLSVILSIIVALIIFLPKIIMV